MLHRLVALCLAALASAVFAQPGGTVIRIVVPLAAGRIE